MRLYILDNIKLKPFIQCQKVQSNEAVKVYNQTSFTKVLFYSLAWTINQLVAQFSKFVLPQSPKSKLKSQSDQQRSTQ